MRVSELMTEKVLTIGPEAPIKDVARILVANGISGLPVCDIERRVLGVVSEGDILYKEHDPTEGRIGGPLGWVIDGTVNHAAHVKATASTARTAMTSPGCAHERHTPRRSTTAFESIMSSASSVNG